MAFRGHSFPRADQASRLSDPQPTSGQPAREELPAQARHGCALSQVDFPARWVSGTDAVGCFHMLYAMGSMATRAATPWT
ncbi:hypothetical protein ACVWY0_002698 [Arthrobacter sp. UYNi723]